MPDPHEVATASKDMAEDQQMDAIVSKALKKKKRRRRTRKAAYDKLAMLLPSVTKVLQGASYGAAAGGFKPSARVDSSNGWSSTKTPASSPTHTKLSDDGWQGIGGVRGRSVGSDTDALSEMSPEARAALVELIQSQG